MGVLNVTPDSFYDGGKYNSGKAILDHVEKMVSEGADFIDIGGYSSRPGAADVTAEEEKRRVVTAITAVVKEFPGTIISADTFRSDVARVCVEAGAGLVNDISGGNLDPDMFNTIAGLGVPYVVMHMRGTPQTMKTQTRYDNLLHEVVTYFHQKVSLLQNLGVKDIIIDPGFGFAKTREQNFEILQHLDELSILGRPILVGLSRKSMIWKTLEVEPDGALNGTTALNTIALLKGAGILRVHDVMEAKQVVKLFTSLRGNVNA